MDRESTLGSPRSSDASGWSEELARLAGGFGVPGAALGVIDLGADRATDRVRIGTHGVINVRTGVAVTPDTVFQIGSISKPYTATLMMQAVEDGKIFLDQPVHEILGDAPISKDHEASRLITVRHLLTHRSGIDGDIFTDTGPGDDCVARYVSRLAEARQLFRPGTLYSYSNSGWVVAGRLLEIVTGQPWRQLLASRIVAPLGLIRTGTRAIEAILHSAAVGHTGAVGEPREPVDHWALPPSIGPAGTINSTVREVLTVAAEHARNGGRLMSAASAVAMRADYGPNPPGLQITGHQGLGWMCGRWGGHEVFGHNGLTVGQAAYLLIAPTLRMAVCLLTNGPGAANLWHTVRSIVMAGYGVQVPVSPLIPTDDPVEPLEPWLGRYVHAGERLELVAVAGGYRARIQTALDLGDDHELEDLALHPVGGRLWSTQSPGQHTWTQLRAGRLSDAELPPGGARDRRYVYSSSRIAVYDTDRAS